MSDILNKILATKAIEVASAKAKVSLEQVQSLAKAQDSARNFIGARV
jgi:indole-3-glycerol phosphate synthase